MACVTHVWRASYVLVCLARLVNMNPKQINKIRREEKQYQRSRLYAKSRKTCEELEAEIRAKEKQRDLSSNLASRSSSAGYADNPPADKDDKEIAREERMKEVISQREKYESKHMGNYERIYPCPHPDTQATYDSILTTAAEMFHKNDISSRTKEALTKAKLDRLEKQRKEEAKQAVVEKKLRRSISGI